MDHITPSTAFVKNLNPQQAQAVVHNSGCLAVVAGAGSGKTAVLTRRIGWLVRDCGLTPDTVMAVTFTNKAAAEMRRRLEGMGVYGLNQMWLGTFHGLGARFLREHATAAGLRPRFSILDAGEAERLFKNLAESNGWIAQGMEIKEATAWIASKKDDGQSPSDITPSDSKEALLLKAYRTYQDECDRRGVVDFGELLLRPYQLLKKTPALRQSFASRFSHFLVDEFQDTNRVQYEWISLLSENGRTADVTVVGDMDQSIYSWRGAQMANLPKFVKDFKADTVKLEQNYRSTGHVLAAANAVISNNKQRIPKLLRTDQPLGNPIRLSIFRDGREEAEWIAKSIAASHMAKGDQSTWSNFAVLYRMGALSRQLEEALLRHRVPYKIHGGLRFFDRMEVKDALAHLRTLSDTSDETALERALAAPPRGLGPSVLDPARAVAQREGRTLYDVLVEQSSAWSTRPSRSWSDWEQGRQKALSLSTLEEMTRWAIEETGLLERAHKLDEKDHTDRAANLEELVSVAAEFDRQNISIDPMTRLVDFLDTTVLAPEIESQEAPSVVRLMTIHAAKGLEFPCVFMVGCDEGIFPSGQAGTAEKMEEERRLAYVAITRAERRLCLTSVQERMIYGKTQNMSPSRFIGEIPKDHLEWDSSTVSRQIQTTSSAMPAWKNGASSQNSITNSGSSRWSQGQRVEHRVFGVGHIVRIIPNDPEPRLVVKFGRTEKTILPSLAGLKRA